MATDNSPIDAAGFSQFCAGVADFLENGPADEMLRNTRQIIWQGQSDNFTAAASPEGQPWPLRKWHGHPEYDKGRSGIPGHPLLIDTGAMYQSLIGGADHTETLQGRMVETGTTLYYAAKHETGEGRMPARPFIGIGEQFLAKIESEMEGFVLSAFAGVM